VQDVCGAPSRPEIDVHFDFEGFRVRDPSELFVKRAHRFVCPIELGEEWCERMLSHIATV
jgi:hypothetical protein